jgi:tight adherence protein B
VRVAYTNRLLPEDEVGDQLLLTVLAGSALLGAGLWAALRVERHKERREQRLKTIATTAPSDEVPGASLRRPLPRGGRVRALLSLPAGLRAGLEPAFAAAGNRVRLPQLVLTGIAAAAVTGFAARFMGFNPVLVIALSGAAAAAVPRFLLRFLQIRYRRRFLDVFPDAIDLIVRAVRAGLPALDAIELAAREIAAPVGTEFQKVLDDTRIGVALADALNHAADRIRVPDFRFFVASVVLQRRTGGGLAETLLNLSTLIRQRRMLRLKARALTAEAKASAVVISIMPLVAGAGLYLVKPDMMALLFADRRGRFMLGVAIVSLLLGIATMGAIIRRTLR